jgi:hypothetical protein
LVNRIEILGKSSQPLRIRFDGLRGLTDRAVAQEILDRISNCQHSQTSVGEWGKPSLGSAQYYTYLNDD